MNTHIGTSGWSYDHWEGVLYPPGTPPRDRLDHYVARFSTVELNASFYRWPREATFAKWRRRLPGGFQLSVKAPRGLTHGKRLFSPEVWTERISRSWHELADKRAILLVQLPPDLQRDDARLEFFLAGLPDWIRVAVELRHPTWHHDDVFGLLQRYGAAYCVMSGANLHCVLRATAPFVYVRMYGPDHECLCRGSYSDEDLRWWADRIRGWEWAGKEVYVYFTNDDEGNAVRNAVTLRAFLDE